MNSTRYKYWRSVVDLHRCARCEEKHGQIYLIDGIIPEEPPLHERCRCSILRLEAKKAGTATKTKLQGADWWLKTFHKLPEYYISENEARQLGWKPLLANLAVVAPGKMLTKGIYYNRNHHLPECNGRVWYEADINFTRGYRGNDRILFSNDGLIFVTYDHYATFVEIV